MAMTNEERRRASGAAMEVSRRAAGKAMEDNRRAIGTAMTERRTGKSVAEDVNALVSPARQRRTLPSVDPVGALPSQRGRGTYQPAPSAGGGGIASPLVETDADMRTYHEEVLLPSTDGLTWIRWRSVKRIHMVDANNAEVVLEFRNDLSE